MTEKKEKEKNKKSLVKYSEGLASVPLTGMTAREQDLFMSICYNTQQHIVKNNIKDFEVAKIDVEHSFDEIRDLIGFTSNSNVQMVKELKSMSLKFSQIKLEEAPNQIDFHIILPITDFATDYKKGIFKTGIHPEFAQSLNEKALDGSPGKRYTLADVKAVSSVSSVYSKQCLRVLFRYRSSGIWITTIEGLKYYLSIADSYAAGEIRRKVLDPIERDFEAADLFESFSIEERKEKGSGTGRKKIVGYVFRFKFKDEEIIKSDDYEGVVICPKCGRPLNEIKKDDGTSFYGHKDYWTGQCRATWTNLEDIPTNREKQKEESDTNLLKKYLDHIRRQENEDLLSRVEEIRTDYPEIYELYEKKENAQKDFIMKMGLSESGRQQRQDAKEMRNMLDGMMRDALEAAGFDRDYMEHRYLCNECKDTSDGRETGTCSCTKKRLEEAKAWKEKTGQE